MTSELKPCPFCGAESSVNYGVGGTIAYVRCEGCGVYSPHFSKKQEAIDFWNARAERACVIEPRDGFGVCSECGAELTAYEGYDPWRGAYTVNNCPYCGAKVVSE